MHAFVEFEELVTQEPEFSAQVIHSIGQVLPFLLRTAADALILKMAVAHLQTDESEDTADDQDHSLEEVQVSNLRNVVIGLVCLLSGVFLANYFGAELGAQQQAPTEAQAWEIYHGKYPRPASDDTRFYVIRHNRLTGETQIIACEDRDGCTQFVVEIEN